MKKLRAGSSLTLKRGNDGTPDALQYIIDPDHELDVSRSSGSFQASVVEIPARIQVLPIWGTMQGSLFESIDRAGEKAELAIRMAEVFAWDLDFYTDPQPGDAFCLLVEKKQYENGQSPTYGRILAARYDNAGTAYEGYLFAEAGGETHYYFERRPLIGVGISAFAAEVRCQGEFPLLNAAISSSAEALPAPLGNRLCRACGHPGAGHRLRSGDFFGPLGWLRKHGPGPACERLWEPVHASVTALRQGGGTSQAGATDRRSRRDRPGNWASSRFPAAEERKICKFRTLQAAACGQAERGADARVSAGSRSFCGCDGRCSRPGGHRFP